MFNNFISKISRVNMNFKKLHTQNKQGQKQILFLSIILMSLVFLTVREIRGSAIGTVNSLRDGQITNGVLFLEQPEMFLSFNVRSDCEIQAACVKFGIHVYCGGRTSLPPPSPYVLI